LILVDTSGLLAAVDRGNAFHERAAGIVSASPGRLVLSPFVLAELDYLVARDLGTAAELALLEQVGDRAYQLAGFTEADVAEAHEVIRRYRDQRIGLADASLVVLAGRLETDRVLTFDERHFRVLKTPSGRPFTLLPADA
jgi:uncharacterized protein